MKDFLPAMCPVIDLVAASSDDMENERTELIDSFEALIESPEAFQDREREGEAES